MFERLHYYIKIELINHQGVKLTRKKLIKIQQHYETPQDSRQTPSMVMNHTLNP